jgi:hypothetical protein
MYPFFIYKGGLMAVNTLPVYYVSQLGSGASEHNNDCGAASSLMELGTYNLAKTINVDQFYNSMYPSGDMALNVSSMQARMGAYGLVTEWKVGLTTELIFYYLRNRRPLLALIHYAPLVDAGVTEKKIFRGAHFVVITGIDFDSVYIDDPYRTDGATNVAVPIAVFEQSWAQCALDGNPVGGAIIPKLPIQDLGVVVPPTNDEYILLVAWLNLRAKATSTSTLVRVIYRTIEPSVHVLANTLTNSYVQMTDLSGWVYFPSLKKK